MSIPNMPDVNALLKQKIAEIQRRLPVKMNIGSDNEQSFADALKDASSVNANAPVQDSTASAAAGSLASMALSTLNSTDSVGSAAPVIDVDLIASSLTKSEPNTKYPLVSGSYESVYSRLTQLQIQELMPRIDAAIQASSLQYKLDPKLIRAVIKEESGFQPFALSTSGAMGLMQLMPGTADGLGVNDPYNIEQNILAGTQYLYYQLKEFNGNLELALAAYNAGPNAVKKFGGIPPYDQTQKYVKKVINSYQLYQSTGDI